MKRILRRVVGFVIVFVFVVAAGSHVQGKSGGAQRARNQHKLDNHLRASLEAGSSGPQRVIIRTRAGERSALKRRLATRGDRVLADHESINALTAIVHAEDLDSLAAEDGVLSVSTDAVVRAKLLGGLLGGLLRDCRGTGPGRRLGSSAERSRH